MMNRYEILMLATPSITGDEAKNLEKGLSESIKKANGELLSFEKWGKCRLAYPVRKNDYGIYFLTRFEVDADATFTEDIKTAFTIKHNDYIMRHVMVKLNPEQGLEYKRPQTVEEVPTRDVDTFLRKNKMDSLLSTSKEAEKTAAPAQEATEIKTSTTENAPAQGADNE